MRPPQIIFGLVFFGVKPVLAGFAAGALAGGSVAIEGMVGAGALAGIAAGATPEFGGVCGVGVAPVAFIMV